LDEEVARNGVAHGPAQSQRSLDRQVKLFTSRYQNQDEIAASTAKAVGITVGRPRFKLKYERDHLDLLAPRKKSMGKADWSEQYRQYLEELGADRVSEALCEVSASNDDADLLLLCYEHEHVHGRDACHRFVFADWWQEQTGQEVVEIEDRGPKPVKRNKFVPKPKSEQRVLFDADDETGKIEYEPPSAAIDLMTWDANVMTVTFTSGHSYRYEDVPRKVAAEWVQSPSAGKYFHAEVKGSFEGERISEKEKAA
jgi:hypothetical protein